MHIFVLVVYLYTSTYAAAQLSVIQAQNYKTISYMNSWYDVCGPIDYWNAGPACVDGNPATICHSNTYSNRQWLRVDLQDEYSIVNVQLQGRGDPGLSYTRDDITQVWIGNTESDPAASGNIQCSFPGPFTGPGAIRNFACTNLMGRFVFLLNSCASACILNPAEVYVYVQSPSVPTVFTEIAFQKPGYLNYPTSVERSASAAVDGDLGSLMHSTAPNDILYAWWDMGSPLQPVDRIFALARPHITACTAYFRRENALNLAVTNDTSSLAFIGATPAAALCGMLPDPLPVPWNWYGANCGPKLARYVWVRHSKYWNNPVCRIDNPTICSLEYYLQFPELQVFSSRCPSLRSFVDTTKVTLVDEFSSGCGATGSRKTAAAWTGSRCRQTCAAGAQRMYGGSNVATVECRVGEWVALDVQATGGPLVCGNPCPARPAPPLSIPTSCRQIVAENNFNSGTQQISDWYPVYRGAALPLANAEVRAQIYSGVLTLSSYPTIWAVNEPIWASLVQTANWLKVSASVMLGSASSCAGLVLRLTNTNPATYYLLRLRIGNNQHTFSRINNGVETNLGSAIAGVCTISTTSAVNVVFQHVGTTLQAWCNGVNLGSVQDTSAERLVSGSAGLFSARLSDAMSATSIFDNLVIERGCDGPNGGCNTGLPGHRCIMECTDETSIPADPGSLSVTCGANGAWSAPDLSCIPRVRITPPFIVEETAQARTAIGNPFVVTPLPDGVTVNFSVASTHPAAGPFSIGSCDGQLRLSLQGVLDFEGLSKSYNVTVATQLTAFGAPTTTRSNITVWVTDVNEPPSMTDVTISVPENANINSAHGIISCQDVDGFPLRMSLTVNSPEALFNVSATLGPSMPQAGQVNLLVVRQGLDFERLRTYTLLATCTDNFGLSASAFVNVQILDVPEAPVFFPETLNITIAENAMVGQGGSPTCAAWDPENNTITYSLATANAFFSVLPSGAVVAAAPLDYETAPMHVLQVRATDSTGLSVVATVRVFVTDVNEPPVFLPQNRSVLENAAALNAVGAPLQVVDPESDVLTFDIVEQTPAGNHFIVDNPSGQIRVRSSNSFNFFLQRLYRLNISATDAGTPGGGRITSSAIVYISVNWTNAVPTLPSYTFNITENLAAGAGVGTVVGTDRDVVAPILDTLTYSILSQESTASGDVSPFVVHPTSGTITVGTRNNGTGSATLDFEAKRTFALTMQVADRFGGVATSQIIIRLQNVNEPPSLPAGLSFAARSRAFQDVGPALSTLVVDPDRLAPGVQEAWTFAFDTPAQNLGNTFQIHPLTGQISVANASALPFFTGAVYTLAVRVTDAGIDGPALSSVADITIHVTDSNQVPVCGGPVSFTIAERAATGAIVGVAGCTDPDFPQQSLTYRLDAAGGNINRPFPFKVTSSGNMATIAVDTAGVNGEVDFEGAFAEYNCTLTATDSHATAPLSATLFVRIRVLDVAERPYFNAGPRTTNPGVAGNCSRILRINELANSAAILIGSPIQAYDQDASDVNALVYSFDASSPLADRNLFTLNPSNGEIRLTASNTLDFETRASIELRVYVQDSTGLTDSCNVTVLVLDDNEPPLIVSPPLWNAQRQPVMSLHVLENTTANSVIGTLRAFDVDAGPAGQLAYQLTQVTSFCERLSISHFAINSLGNISLVDGGVLDWEDCTQAMLTVNITDNGVPPLTTQHVITVNILDVPDAVIDSMQLMTGDEALGRGVDVGNPNSTLASQYTYSPGTRAIISTQGTARVILSGRGLGLTAARLARDGAVAYSFTAAYGPLTQPTRYSSTCSQYVQGSAIMCSTAAGVGIDHDWRITVNGVPASVSQTLRSSYMPPDIINVTKVVPPDQDQGDLSNQLLSTVGGESLTIRANHLGPVGTVVELRYGPVTGTSPPIWRWNYRTLPCSWDAGGVSVICSTLAGIGGPSFGFQMIVDGQVSVVFPSTTIGYSAPHITTVTGSPMDTRGGSASSFNISGKNFGPAGSSVSVILSINFTAPGAPVLTAVSCRHLQSHTLLTCAAPAGVGQNLQVQVTVGERNSPVFASTLSYKQPVLTSVSGNGAAAAQTTGGQEFLLHMDFVGPALNAASGDENDGLGLWRPLVTYGKPNGRQYQAVGCRVVTNHEHISCKTAEGSGAGLVVNVTIGGTSVRVPWVVIGYAPPAIASYARKGAVSARTSGLEEVELQGNNFGPLGTPVDVATYGLNGTEFTATNCTVITAHIAILCLTAPGAGKDLVWTLMVDGLRSVVPSTRYTPPVITSITGPGSVDGNTEGGQLIVLEGSDLGFAEHLISVTYGPFGTGYVAQNCTVSIPHTQVRCWTVPGTGRRLRWMINVGHQTSDISTSYTSYAMPTIISITPSTVPTSGGTLLTVMGGGFAPRYRQADVRFLCDVGFSAETQPSAADMQMYWAAKHDGIAPPTATVDRVQAWMNALTDATIVQRHSDTRMTVVAPDGVGVNNTCFVVIDGIPSNIIQQLSYEAPYITNVAPETNSVAPGFLRVYVEGRNLCRSQSCGTLFVSGVQADPVSWTHAQIEVVVLLPPSGTVLSVYVRVGTRNSNTVEFSNTAPAFPANLNAQSKYDNMNTMGGQSIQITSVTGISAYETTQLSVFIGPYAASNITRTLQTGAANAADALWTIAAISPPGVGMNLPIILSAPGGQSRASPEFVFSYGAPRILQSRRVQANGIVVTDGGEQGISTLGEIIELEGANFGTSMLENGTLSVQSTSNDAMMSANVVVQSITHTAITVLFPAGVGKGFSLTFTVGGQTSNMFYVGYRTPTIISIAPQSAATIGGTVVRLRGHHWGTEMPVVAIGGAVCVSEGTHFAPTSSSAGLFDCFLPSGQGVNNNITIRAGGQTAVSNVTYTYAAPRVTSIFPQISASDGRSVGAFTATFDYVPGPRVLVSLRGENFGRHGLEIDFVEAENTGLFLPTVRVNSSHIVFHNDSLIQFYVPEADGAEYNVVARVSGQSSDGAGSTPVVFQYEAPRILAWNRRDRQRSVCGSYERCYDVPAGWMSLPLNNSSENAGNGGNIACKQVYYDCYSTRGGYVLDIYGTSFGTLPARITIGGILCPLHEDTDRNSHYRLSCVVPQGMGSGLPIVVATGGRTSVINPNASFFSYDPPEIISALPSTPHADGVALQLRGRNFGMVSNPVHVWISDAVCDNAEWVNDGIIACGMAATTVGPKNVTIVAANHTTQAFAHEFEQVIVTKCSPGFAGLVGERCVDCRRELLGAECPGGELFVDLVVSSPGFWRSNVSTSDTRCHPAQVARPACPIFLACEPPDSCLGANECAEGYQSFRCSECIPGQYYRIASGGCQKCPNSPLAVVIVFLLAGLAAITVAYLLHRYKVSFALISIGIDYGQVVAMFGRTRISWPPEVREFLNVLSAFNVDLQLAAPECLVPDVSYGLKFAAIELLPWIVFGLLAIVYLLDYGRKRLCNDKRKVDLHAALPTFVTLEISVLRVLYLYVTRTSLDVFSCSPTTPPDGKTYMAGYLEVPCNEEGGLHQKLLAPAIVALILYSIALPLTAAFFMRANRMTIKTDQILRAKGLGDDKLAAPRLYLFRRMWHKLYYHFKPEKFYWELVLLARKFLIAFTSLMFRNSPSYQLSMALLVMFAAFALHVRHLPYMSHKDAPAVVEEHETKAQTDAMHAKIEAELRAMVAKHPNSKRRAVSFVDMARKSTTSRAPQDIARLGLLYLFDYNTVEAVLLGCSVLLLLGGIMFDSSRFSAEFAGYYNAEYASLTYSIMLLLSFSVIYFMIAFFVDMIFVCSPETLTKFCGGKQAAKPSRRSNKSIGSFADDAAGVVNMAVNPVLANILNSPHSSAHRTPSGLAATISPTSLSTIEDIPDRNTWNVVKAAYSEQASLISSLQAELRTLKLNAAVGYDAPDHVTHGPLGRVAVTRRQFLPTRSETPVGVSQSRGPTMALQGFRSSVMRKKAAHEVT